MKTLGFYNGKYGPLEEMTVPMTDRACYFGDGIYDATYCRNYIIYALDEHVDRFFENAALLELKITYTKDELKALLTEMVKKLDSGEQFVYWQLSRGTGLRNHAFPDESVPANLWIMLKPFGIKDTYKPLKLISAEDTRFFHCNIKTLNLIPSVIATQRALEAGADECVLHRGERVTECAHSNISMIKDGALITPPSDNLILPGIARKHLIAMCRKLGYEAKEEVFTMNDLMNADEVILTSSSALCVRISSIDGITVGGKNPAMLKVLQDALLADFIEKTTP